MPARSADAPAASGNEPTANLSLSSSMHGAFPLPAAAPAAVPTPPPVAAAPMPIRACGNCGYRVAPGQVTSWCPGCGRLFDVPVTGAPPGARVETPLPEAPPAVFDTPAAPARRGSLETTQGGGVAAAPPAAAPPGWALVLLRAGERLDRYPLRTTDVSLGRGGADYDFPEDPYLSPRHARLSYRGDSFWLEDLGSRNGVFLRLSAPAELRHGDVITFGSLVLRYESEGSGPRSTSLLTSDGGVKFFGSGRERARGRVVRILQDGSDGPAYPLTPARTIVGRKTGHFLFPDDPLLSRQHVQFYERDGEMWVEDLGSSNGTMVRLRAPVPVSRGVVFRIGDVTLEVVSP
jgi:pSer/pThr/pTyr-binding forkhead associated (FHA) protein